jgi:hypothetical protein
MNGHDNTRQYSDQYHCADCGKQWDVNDPDPPECRRECLAGEQAIREMRRLLGDRNKG